MGNFVPNCIKTSPDGVGIMLLTSERDIVVLWSIVAIVLLIAALSAGIVAALKVLQASQLLDRLSKAEDQIAELEKGRTVPAEGQALPAPTADPADTAPGLTLLTRPEPSSAPEGTDPAI